MPITIGSNIASLISQRRLNESSTKLSKTYERLSSGQRINSAADDAAGLAISESLKSDRRVFNQGIRNFNDGISLLNIADGAIEQLSGIVVRLKELSEQSANGTYSATQRKAIDKEAQALSKEYTRIAQSTKFNGLNLLNGSTGDIRLQGGYGIDGSIKSGLGGAIGNGSFGTVASYVTETNFSRSVVLGDLNGDGILDMVTSGYDGGGVGNTTIRIGLADGSFGSAVTYSNLGAYAYGTALGDINGDGILDLVNARTGGGGGAVVRLGNGNGTFGSGTSYATGGNSFAVSLADLNQDGNIDIVTAGFVGGGGRTTVFLGQGNGSFGTATTYSMDAGSSNAVSLGDINGDGIVDMVSAGYSGSVGTATIRLGQGNGTFGSSISYTMDAHASNAVSLGDINGDGILDMVSAGYNNSATGTVTVRLGAGNGTFGSATSYLTQGSGVAMALKIGDLNGDGLLDIVSSGGSGVTTIRLGAGDGTFGAASSFVMDGGTSYANALADLNGDGVLDIVTAGNSSAGSAAVRLASTNSGVSALLPFDLTTLSGARQALPIFDSKIRQLATQRGTIGAFQSRVQVGINNLQSAAENYAAAESRIRDADIAQESAELVRLNILQQAASSVLAQANLQPELALRLLRN